MVYSREEAAQRAEASMVNTPRYCQKWTRELYDAPSVGDVDRDGDADAVDGWNHEKKKHFGDQNPPRGVPVAWAGGSLGQGHRAISLGDRKIRSTDAGGVGRVATVDLDWIEKNWGLQYLGWSEDISGIVIPTTEGTQMSNYSKADTTTQWFQDNYPGSDLYLVPETMVVVIHTTESTGWPSYNGGSTAPNYTGLPPIGLRSGQWRAHFPDEKSARALRNDAGGVDTNTLNCVQLELIGTCDPANATSWGGSGQYVAGRDYVYWPNATKRQLRWVARILADFSKRHGLRLVAPRAFLPYPSSYGNTSVRLSGEAWRNTTGVVGHQHVPENSHGDPGNIDINYILKRARRRISPPKPASQIKAISWNSYVKHDPDDVVNELKSMMRTEDPDVFFLYEASNLHGQLDPAGYKVIHAKPKALVEGNQPATGNVAVLVKPGVQKVGRFRLAMEKFWTGPNLGLPQDPRVYRWLRVEKEGVLWKLGGFHFPFGVEARSESTKAVRRWFRNTLPGRPVVAFGDYNRDRAYVESKIAQKIAAEVAGKGIDFAVYKNCKLVSVKDLGKHGSDHPAMLYVFEK